MTDDSTTPPGRSWAPETGWPSDDVAPAWAEPEDLQQTSDEDAYDAWLDAQAEQDADEDAQAPVSVAPAEPAPSGPLQVEEPPAAESALPSGEPGTPDLPLPLEAEVLEAETLAAAAETPIPTPSPIPMPIPAEPEPAVTAEPEPTSTDIELADIDLADTDLADTAPGAAAPAALDRLPAVPGTRPAAPLLAPLVVLVVVLALVAGFLGLRTVSTRGGGEVERARRAALTASRSAARLVFSYDYRHLEKDFAAGKAVTTGKFAADYARTTGKLVNDVAARYKAIVIADVSDAGVVTASKNRVVTLVFLNQRSSSSLAAGQKITQSRLIMVLVRKHGRWLVSKVDAF